MSETIHRVASNTLTYCSLCPEFIQVGQPIVFIVGKLTAHESCYELHHIPWNNPMSTANSILPSGYQWVTRPMIMLGDFHGFLPNGNVNVWYPITTGWGNIKPEDFAPGEFERLEPGCKVERYCGDVNGPRGKEFIIRAKRGADYKPTTKPAKRVKGQIFYVIWLRTGQCVTGFSYPPKLHVNEDDHIAPIENRYLAPTENEIPITEGCYAILGNERPYMFDREDSANNVAYTIPGAKVEPWSDD